MRWFLESQDLQSKRIPYSELFPDPLQHLVNDWPKVTAEQFTFPKFPQGLTTTMIKDSEVFKTPNLKQSVNIFPPAAFLRACRCQGTLCHFKSEGGTFLHPPKFFDHSTLSCWASYGITSSLYCNKRVKSNKVKVKLLSRVQLFATPWTVAYQAPPSMGFPRQECWSGLPFPSPGDLPDPGVEPRSPALLAEALLSEPPGKPLRAIKETLTQWTSQPAPEAQMNWANLEDNSVGWSLRYPGLFCMPLLAKNFN